MSGSPPRPGRPEPKAEEGERRYLTTVEAAALLGFRTPAGIRECVRRGELEPDGMGARRCYLFHRETLDAFAKRRLERRRAGQEGASPAAATLPQRRGGRPKEEDPSDVLRELLARSRGRKV